MKPGIGGALLPRCDRPIVIGEYPYYRAAPDRWAANVQQLHAAGVDVVSCYVPWRFHEVGVDGERWFDFTGETDPQRDVNGLLALVAEAGLRALVKPGPFVHAEVQLGGLPDRLCDRRRHTPIADLLGRPFTSQGRPLPSLFDASTRAEVEVWMQAVADRVIAPRRGPDGVIVGVQLGNEGLYSEASLSVWRHDASRPARHAFADWLAANGAPELRQQALTQPAEWPPRLRHLWSRWSGQAIVEHWRWLARLLPPDVRTLVNIPLAPVASVEPVFDAWAARQPAFAASGHLVGHTEWIGNAATSVEVFQAHLAGIRLGQTDVLEANWGFTWADAGFAQPRTPLFHALLALMLGSTTCSVYVACATRSWNSVIDMDSDGLLAEGVDPGLHAPPYCPGAPTTESGAPGRNASALRVLTGFLRCHGRRLLETDLVVDGVLDIERTLSEEGAWSSRPTVLQQVVSELCGLLLRHGVLIDPRWMGRQEDCPPDVPRGAVRCRSGTDGAGAPGDLLIDVHAARSELVTGYLEGLARRSAADRDRWRGRNGHAGTLRRRSLDRRTEVIGVFNATDVDDTAVRNTAGGSWELHAPAGSAAILIIQEDAVSGWVATPLDSRFPEVALSTPQGLVRGADWFGRFAALPAAAGLTVADQQRHGWVHP